MRMIGQLPDERSAQTFCDYLTVQGIECETRPLPKGEQQIWILAENQLEAAKAHLLRFREQPGAAEFQQAATPAEQQRLEEAQKDEEFRKKFRGRAQVFRARRVGPLTATLIALSVGLALFSGLGSNREVLSYFTITALGPLEGHATPLLDLPEVRAGQVWRLITPIFIHFGVLHLLFNMLWLMDLGAQVEYRQGTARLGWLVLVLALACNLGQFLVSGPNFGGMSGVVYGLIGYIWLRGTRDPASGLYLDKRNFFLAIAWFVYCYTGFAGPIGNTAHAVGLAVGLSWGFVSAQVVRRRKDTDGNRR